MTIDNTLVLAGHGSHVSPASSDPLFAHADRLRDTGLFDEVIVAVWQGEPHLRTALRRARGDPVTVVPVMMAGGYFADEVFPRELRLTGGEPIDVGKTVRYTDPVGTHPALVDVIVRRAESALDEGVSGGDVGLALVGHGTHRHEASGATTRDHARRLRDLGQFEEVHACFLDQEPRVETLTDRMAMDDIVVVPLFVADGPHTREDIPRAIGLPVDPVGPTSLDGRRVRYTGAVGTAPSLTAVITDLATANRVRYTATGSDGRGDAVAATAAFGQWLDNAPDGRRWGELLISVADVASGPSGYSVRHVRDAGVPKSRLDRVATVADLRETVRYDTADRYRPFAGAKTLPAGWVRDVDSRQALYRTVDTVYPGSIVDWYRERNGELGEIEFQRVAARQTGRYDGLGSVPEADRNATIAACCADCSRRPVWAPDGGGQSAIPCWEPCSFLLAAMTTFHDLDPERQSAANTPVDGDLDRPGNRYRRRYRQAKTGQVAAIPGDGT